MYLELNTKVVHSMINLKDNLAKFSSSFFQLLFIVYNIIVARQKRVILLKQLDEALILYSCHIQCMSHSKNTNQGFVTKHKTMFQVPALEVRTETKRQFVLSAASLGTASFITFLQCPDTLQWGEKQSNQ